MEKLLRRSISAIVAEILVLLCLAVMFLAGNDIWHDTGQADIWHLSKPPFADVRVFVCASYALVALVLARIAVRLARLVGQFKHGA